MNTRYRFLPWARRGLSGSIEQTDTGNVLQRRARVSVGITVSNVTPAGVDLSLYGPGDVQGIDPTLIVRTTPRRHVTDAEPNYLAGIEFDAPDFPWMFTPAKAGNDQRLRPWLVLIVLDRSKVNPPSSQRAQPLPTIRLAADVSAGELPDLGESWAWAHTQIMTDENTLDIAGSLSEQPALNVSRLLCPRRLAPNRSWLACLVPAFDAGVERGLGGVPDTNASLAPAWNADNPGELVLPVYYHWEFSTGIGGDFESLARKLKPFRVPETLGVAPMYIGDAAPELPFIEPDSAESVIAMDGVLRAHSQSSGTLADIPDALEDGLRQSVNAPVDLLKEGPSDATPALTAPIYGQWHKNRHTVAGSGGGWHRELNVDPRARVAAGLGAEVVRENQQEFMQECWQQVGAVKAANQLLGWSRLGYEANIRLYARHVVPQVNDRLLQFAAPLHTKTMNANISILNQIRSSSLPDATSDMAYRRAVSPHRPLIRRTINRLLAESRLIDTHASTRRSHLVTSLAAGRADVEPYQYLPDGLIGSTLLARIEKGEVDAVAGMKVTKTRARKARQQASTLSNTDFQLTPLRFAVRRNLRAGGLITSEHVDNIRLLHGIGNAGTNALRIDEVLKQLIRVAGSDPQIQGVVISVDDDKPPVLKPVFLDSTGLVSLGPPVGQTGAKVPVGTIDIGRLNRRITIGRILTALPAGTLIDGLPVTSIIHVGLDDNLLIDITTPPLRPPVGPLDPGVRPVDPVVPPTGPVVGPVSPLRPGITPMINVPMSGGAAGIGPNAPLVPGRTAISGSRPVIPGTPGADTSPLLATRLKATNTLPLPTRSAAAIANFETQIRKLQRTDQFDHSVAGGELVTFSLSQNATLLREKLDPVRAVPLRIRQLIGVEGRDLWTDPLNDTVVAVPETFDRIMAAPELSTPVYTYLARHSQERFCPGIGVIPPDSMSILETNPRFIESFMVGLNHEMNRELLWREYPTDQRGTPFRHFWDWIDGDPDIEPIHRWPFTSRLGTQARASGSEGQTVLLIRGELLRRYPNSVLLAWRADASGNELSHPPEIEEPVFAGQLEPDVTFAGFSLTETQLLSGSGWFFVIQEQPTEPRFGLDVNPDTDTTIAPTQWNDADWGHTDVAAGRHLRLSAAGRLTNLPLDTRRFGQDAAVMASITLQKPMRVIMHARHILSTGIA